MKNKNLIFFISIIVFISSLFFTFIKKADSIKLNIYKPLYETITFNIDKSKTNDTFITANGKYIKMNLIDNTYQAELQNKNIESIKLYTLQEESDNLPNVYIYKDTSLIIIDNYDNLSKTKETFSKSQQDNPNSYNVYDLTNIIKNNHTNSINFSGYFNTIMILILGFFQSASLFIFPIIIFLTSILYYEFNRREITIFKKINIYYILLPLILTIAILLRLNGLTDDPLWYDEFFTVFYYGSPHQPFGIVYSDIGNPPFYFILVRFWTLLLGTSIIAIKALPFLIGVISLIVTYIFLNKYFDKSTAIAGLFITSINSYYIYYSQEIRTYGLLILLTSLMAYYLFKIMTDDKIQDYILYCLISIVAINSHYYETFVFFFNLIFGLILLFKTSQTYKIKKFIWVNLISLSIFVVYFIHTGYNAISMPGYNSWIKPFSLKVINDITLSFFGFYWLLAIFLISYLIIYFYKKEFNSKFNNNISFSILTYCFSLILIMFSFAFLFSIHKSILVFRYFMAVYPAFIIFMTIIISYLIKTKAKYLGVTLLILFIGTFNSHNFEIIRKANVGYLAQIMDLAYKDAGKYLENGKKVYVMSADDNIIFPPNTGNFYKRNPKINYINDSDFYFKCNRILKDEKNFVLYTDINIPEYINKTNIYNAATKIPVYIYIKD